MTRLAYYTGETGARVELHHADNGVFWTERTDVAGTSVIATDTVRAQEHHEYAEREGHVDHPFPYRLGAVAR